jgi:hypothetical protein
MSPSHSVASNQRITISNLQERAEMASNRNISMVQDYPMDQYNQQIELERQESSARALEDLLIPVQPRKHIQQVKPVQQAVTKF